MVYRIVPRTEDELYHYGVLGMKWGVRRYQNYDGTRIGTGGKPVIDQAKQAGNSVALGQGGKATGNARLAATAKPQGSDSNDGESSSKPKSKADIIFGPESKKGKGKDPSSHAKDMLNEVGNLAEGAGKVAENAKKRDKKVQEANAKQQKTQQKKAKEMSDQELRESINRIKMEREYVSLTTKEVETGYDKFQDVMKDVKDIAITAGAVAGLILSIIKIKQALGHSGTASADQYDELKGYIDSGMFSDDVIAHAACLDSDYILDYYDLTEEDIQHWLDDEDELYHHGVLGMKWGVRRYQNYDGTRIGGGGSNKASNSFRNTIVGGQGGKATGNARLAAKAPGIPKSLKYKSPDTQQAVDAWKKHDDIYWNKVDPARDEYFTLRDRYGENDKRTQAAQDKMMKAIEESDSYAKIATEKFRNIPYDDIDDKVLRIGQHSSTWKSDIKVQDVDNYKGPTIQRWSSDKQDFENYKFESTNPNVEILGDAPGGEIALRRRPKTSDPVSDAKAEAKRKQDLTRSEIQDLKDAYRLTGDRSFLSAAKQKEKALKRR